MSNLCEVSCFATALSLEQYDFFLLDEADFTVSNCAILIDEQLKVHGLCELKKKHFMMLSATFSEMETEILKVCMGLTSDQIVRYKSQQEII